MFEKVVSFNCADKQLLGIYHGVDKAVNVAVLIVVGGPQYRVGSHRQFIQLSRALATAGIPSLRFDYTGMGDSQGDKKSFEEVDGDIQTACQQLRLHSGAEQVVIWGLCDAASAAMMYSPQDPSVKGLVILNPWLRSDAAMGKTMLKYYYLQRLMSKDFWRKLLSGKVNVATSVGDAKGFVKDSVADSSDKGDTYQSRMCSGLAKFDGQVCLILSGVDLTAREFEQQAIGNKAWRVLKSKRTQIHKLQKADHTFSSRQFKQQVEQITIGFIQSIGA